MMKTKMHKIRFWLRLRCRPRSGCLPLAIYQTPKVDLRDPISKGRERIRRERKGRKRKGKWEWGGRMGRRNWGVKEGGKFASLALGGWTPYVTPHSGGVLLSIQNADNYTKKHDRDVQKQTSDVNKTFLSRPRPRPRLWTSRPRPRPRLRVPRPRPRPRLFSQDQGKTLLGRPLNRLYRAFFAMVAKWTQQYTHKVTRHTDADCRGADLSFWVQGTTVAYQGFLDEGGERIEKIGNFFVFFVVVNILFLRILTHLTEM